MNLVLSDLLKLGTLKQIKDQGKTIVKEFKSKHMMVDALKSMQQLESVNTTLKLPVKTRWGSVVTCLESVQLNKVVLRKLAVSEITERNNMSADVKKTILDDDFWKLNEAIVEFLKPLLAAIVQLEADVPNLAEVFQPYSTVRTGMMESIKAVPFTEEEQAVIATILDDREKFCIKMIHKSAYLLDPRYHGELLSDEDKLAAIQFVCELAEKFSTSELLDVDSLKVQQDCVLYAAKNVFFANNFLWKNVAKMSPLAWWNAYSSNQEITKVAVRILRLPATTAAVERSFSCYSNIHSAKRYRLSNDRASKLVFVSLNQELSAQTKQSHQNKQVVTMSKPLPQLYLKQTAAVMRHLQLVCSSIPVMKLLI